MDILRSIRVPSAAARTSNPSANHGKPPHQPHLASGDRSRFDVPPRCAGNPGRTACFRRLSGLHLSYPCRIVYWNITFLVVPVGRHRWNLGFIYSSWISWRDQIVFQTLSRNNSTTAKQKAMVTMSSNGIYTSLRIVAFPISLREGVRRQGPE
jgi:hypothetical protein